MQTIYHTPCGRVLLEVAGGRLRRCAWVSTDISPESLSASGTTADRAVIDEATNQLDRYFCGQLHQFDLPLAMDGTDFTIAVWRQLQSIPYGHTKSYGEIARLIGRPGAARAVAAACSRNPLAIIIPCHRVVGTCGKIGGYTVEGRGTAGISIKQHLLTLESLHRPYSRLF